MAMKTILTAWNPPAGGLLYLNRRLVAKEGIWRERLPLYLAEYLWLYNHRNEIIELHNKQLLKQL